LAVAVLAVELLTLPLMLDLEQRVQIQVLLE
jgi:hypothetical protein